MRILAARAASDGAVLGLGGLFPVTTTVTAITTASDASHPKMNPAPFLTPFLDASTRMNAVNGIGSRLIASPMRRRLRTSTTNPVCSPTPCAHIKCRPQLAEGRKGGRAVPPEQSLRQRVAICATAA